MPNRLLTHIHCPECGRDMPLEGHGERVRCPHCEAQWPLTAQMCARCNHFHPTPTRLCRNCELPLTRVCHRCRTVNWSGDESCLACHEPLDIGQILRRHDPGATRKRLNRQQSDARRLKEIESLASGARMSELLAGEEARLAELRRRQAIIRQRERRMLFVAYGLLFLFIISVVAYVILIR